MAISVDSTTNLNLIDAADSETGWSYNGLTKTGIDTAIQREGTGCIYGQVQQNTFGYGWHTHGTSVDLTTAGNERVYIWVNSGAVGTEAQKGYMVVIGDGTNRRAYTVGGSDNMPFTVGPWACLMLDTSNLPTSYNQLNGSSAPSLTAITEFGLGVYNLALQSGQAPNVFVDVVRYGSGIIVTSGATDDITFKDIADYDASKASGRAFGIIREIQPGVYGIQGDILLGDTGGSSIDFKEQDSVVIFEDRVAGTGSNTAFQFKGQHSTTGTFRLEMGVAVSSGDNESGRSGVSFISANPDNQPVTFDFSDSDIEDVFMYGGGLTGCKGTIKFSADATNGISHHISGVSFSNCSQVDPGVTVVRNCTIAGYTADTDAALLWNDSIDIKNCRFLGISDATTGIDPHAIEHPAVVTGGYTYDNLTFSGNDYDINFSDTSTGADLVINATNGSDPATYEITGNGNSVTINNTKTLTVNVEDASGNPIQGARVYMYEDDTAATVLFNELSDTAGQVTRSDYNYSSDTPVAGWVRKASASPYYEQGIIAGTITSNGLEITVQLVSDE